MINASYEFVDQSDTIDIDLDKNPHLMAREYGGYNVSLKALEGGRGIVPIKKPRKTWLDVSPGEPKEVSWRVYEAAVKIHPTVFRSVMLTGQMATAYGYKFIAPYKTVGLGVAKDKDQVLEFMNMWSDHANFDEILQQAVICGKVFGCVFFEKLWDIENGSDSRKDKWVIPGLKLLHPLTMFVDRNKDGSVKAFYQRSNQDKTLFMEKDKEKAIKFYPEHIVFIKFNDFLNSTYGQSELEPLIKTLNMHIGMIEDMALMVQRRASPMIHWSVGDANSIISPGDLINVQIAIEQAGATSGNYDVITPGIVTGSVLGAGEKAMDIRPYIDLIQSQIIMGTGTPEVMLGEGNETTEATALYQIESFAQHVKALQTHIANEFRKQLFVDLINPPKLDGGEANRKRKLGRGRATENLTISPELWARIPKMWFNPIESLKERRQREQVETQNGIATIPEMRENVGYFGEYDDENLSPANRAALGKLDIEREKNEIMKSRPAPSPAKSSA